MFKVQRELSQADCRPPGSREGRGPCGKLCEGSGPLDERCRKLRVLT